MSFRYRNFKLIGLNFSGIPTMWSYTTDDTIAQVTAEGYFDDPRLDVEPVDIIKVQASDGPYEVQLVGGVASVVIGTVGNEINILQYGASSNDIGPALLKAWNELKSVGGTIYIPSGLVKSSQQVFGRASQTVKIVSQGLCKVQPTESPMVGYMWEFDNESGVTHVEFHNVQIDGQVTPGSDASVRFVFDGVLVGSSNNLVVDNCFGRFVDGRAWEFRRCHNSKIDIKTYKSGNASKSSVFHTGDPATGDVFNDVLISGTSERDINGWAFEGGTLLRTKEELKIHGSPDSLRGLQILRVADFDIECKPTLDYGKDGFIYVGDSSNAEGLTLEVAQSAGNVTRGTLKVNNHYNCNSVLTTGNADLVKIDCGTANSAVMVTGLFKSITSAGATVSAIGLDAGNNAAYIDLTGVRFAGADSSLVVRDGRASQRAIAMRGVDRSVTGNSDTLLLSFNGYRTDGDTVSFNTSGNGELPPLKFETTRFENAAFGSYGQRFVESFKFGSTSGVTTSAIVAPSKYLIAAADSSGNQCPSDLERIQIGATGVTASHDDANFWRVDIYQSTTLVHSLAVTMDPSPTSTSETPDRIAGNSTRGQVMDYWENIDTRYLKGNFFSIELVKVGSPADIDDLMVTTQYVIRT